TIDAIAGVGNRFKPLRRNPASACLATAKITSLHPLQGGRNLTQDLLLVLEQAERNLLLETVCTEIGQVDGDMGEVCTGLRTRLECFIRQVRDVSLEALPQAQQLCSMGFHIDFAHL